MTFIRKLGITALLAYTLVITVLRAVRTPNDFAEAHWLLDYRFGFVKRGFIGELLSLVTGALSVPITADLITVLAGLAFTVFCVGLMILSIRLIRKSSWSTEAALVSLAFLSSPFVVMSAHLMGYYDNIFMVLGILSFILVFKGRPWLGAWLQVIAVLTHETSIILVFPLFCLAWLLVNSRRRQVGAPPLVIWPLLLPVCAFVVVAAGQQVFVPKDFIQLYTDRLSQFPYIEDGRATQVPIWLSTTFKDYFSSQSPSFGGRVTSTSMYGLMLPTTLVILFFTLGAYKIRGLSLEALGLLGVCFVPQLMHMVAWDTARIWTYTLVCAYLALWIYSEVFTAQAPPPASKFLSLAVLAVNALIQTPLMDKQTDHLSLNLRLLLYAPVFMAGLAFILRGEGLLLTERLSIQGRGLLQVLGLPMVGLTKAETQLTLNSAHPEVTLEGSDDPQMNQP